MRKSIALLHPGDMGTAVAACLIARDHRVLWASKGRSTSSQVRAQKAGLEDQCSIEKVVAAAGVVLSICPPHAALELAHQVAGERFQGVYIDANAVSPATAREIGRVIETAGGRFVDGGIIGLPPGASTNTNARTRLYVCGQQADEVAALFADTNLQALVLAGPPGSASALKVAYAAWTKGSIALLAAIRGLARHEGVDAALLEEWRHSQPDLARRSEAIVGVAPKAWRWVGEMEEIAASFDAAELPDGFHLAAAAVYERLAQFKDRAPSRLDEVLAALPRTTS